MASGSVRVIRKFLGIVILGMVCGGSIAQAEPLRIVTSIPDLADFVREVGGDLVSVTSISTGVEDPHSVPLKPSFLPLLNRADLVVVVGLDLEHAYMPALIEASRNPKIQPGGPAYLEVATGITPIDRPASLDRSLGELHPLGNPHINLDPELAPQILRNITVGLMELAPQHKKQFQSNAERFGRSLQGALERWRTLGATLKGVAVVSYHSDFSYFLARYGLVQVGTIELRPGIEPTTRHLEELVRQMRVANARIVLREPYVSRRIPDQVAAAVDGVVVTLPIMVGGVKEAGTYIQMMDYLLDSLTAAAAGRKR